MTPLDKMLRRLADKGATKFYAKILAANDNSKNQVYLGGGFTALNIIPHGKISTDDGDVAGAKRDRAKANVDFFWLDEEGLSPAPGAQLILYPKYPEVRMSGFLKNAARAPNELMTSRVAGRVLFLGVCPDSRVIGVISAPDAIEAQFIHNNKDNFPGNGVFLELPNPSSEAGSSKFSLLKELKRIHELGWIPSQKLDSQKNKVPYTARNGGGYTLEAELGITPNGLSEPDYLGWEIKQFGVSDFEKYRAKSPVTLMTPEPSGGIYKDAGIEQFMTEFGYPDKRGVPDRVNFGGRYFVGADFHPDTGLQLQLDGFDASSGKITNLDGAVILIDRSQRIAATWPLTGIIGHWNRKHAKAAYVPSLARNPPAEYRYGAQLQLFEGADVLLLLQAIANGRVYYDPGIKLENISSGKPRAKKRSQFRTLHSSLPSLYRDSEVCDLRTI